MRLSIFGREISHKEIGKLLQTMAKNDTHAPACPIMKPSVSEKRISNRSSALRKPTFHRRADYLFETGRFRTVDAKWQKVLDPQLFRTSQGREVSWFCIEA
jgi:hypothetical protein